MRDHQLFEHTVLANGINVYSYPEHFPISCIELILPVGSGHAIAENHFLPGSPHLLEHAQLIRSQKYPEPYLLDRVLGRKAGNSNAATHSKSTNHWIDVPASEQEFAIDSLVDRVFNPIFEESDLATERGVIINERNQRKFYPGKSRASQYYYTQFFDDRVYPLEQIFGSDEDLAAITPDILRSMHHTVSHTPEVIALCVGVAKPEYLLEKLAALPTESQTFTTSIEPTKWVNKEYHEVFYDTIAQPRLEVGWIHPRLTYKEFRALCFIVGLLINSTQGPLYEEFREEKGWTYGLDGSCMLREHNTIVTLTFPLNTSAQVDFIRGALMDRIQSALANQELVEYEISRQLGNQVYSYQTAGSIISGASTDLITYGLIHTEEEWQASVQAMADPTWRNYILQTFLKPDDMGSMCFMPERRGN